ncbi:serine/threonine-protein kinase pim-2-like [Archocentrus centrarchus]|uniref:serine/threonine-protein kinase pim-2-like n=1 Tax=Archocentrus centrarchus TaxID=63155 RepID=UPI0011E9BF7F|nr:serine/threonine-protein kinase pim-2-like [Archocentrus centrarchus]XP_030591000.1 serine/threonine-protein kinase pim-2-like [Archocentrus centrarchus]
MSFKTINVLSPAASQRNSESCDITTKPKNSLGEHRSMPAKRKASAMPESPTKRRRCASGPPQLAFQAVQAKSGKRKASTERGTPGKKLKCEPSCTNSSDTIRGANWKEKDGAEKLPESETPGRANRKRARDPSPGCSSPSASVPSSGKAFLPFTRDRAHFEAKYTEDYLLGEGGYGSVLAGKRKADYLPVAIKHIKKDDVERNQVVINGKTYVVPLEVLLMIKVGGGPESVGTHAAVSILDWYDLEQEVLLVMERPVPCVNLLTYMQNNVGPLEEHVAKNIMRQLVDAAIKMHTKRVFHRDIKAENLLVETSSSDLRVRVIDFGCGCWVQEEPFTSFLGTSAYAPPEFFICGRYEAAPTTVWQLGTLLYKMLDKDHYFTTFMFLRRNISFNNDLSQDCRNFLEQCLALEPKERATLEEIQQHPWLQNQAQSTPQPHAETPGL